MVLSFLVVAAMVGCGQPQSDTESLTPPSLPPTFDGPSTTPDGSVASSDGSSTTPDESGTPSPSDTELTELTMLSISEGSVFVMRAGTNTWKEAGVGTILEAGDSIKAGDDSHAVITFFEGSTIELEAGARIKVTELNIGVDTGSMIIRLKQDIGNTISRVNKFADLTSCYEIETPACVAVVRGSTMTVYVYNIDVIIGVTTVGNEEGLISVIYQGVEIPIPVGEQKTFWPFLPSPTPPPPVGGDAGNK